jgi:predicted phage terminase large subunit-like protein
VKPKPLVKYYENGLMFPERFNRKVLNDLEAKLGTLTYASQVNQKTQKPGGNLFQEDWFRKISRSEMPKRKYFDSITNYWDTAFTEKEKNSANAFIELGFKDGFVYVLNFAFRWLEFPELIKWMDAVEGVHKIEAKASGKSAAQVLQRMGITAIEVEIEGTDKRTRGNAISPHVEARKVFVPVDIWDSFLNDQRQGILKFPEGTHDDLGDAFVLGITDLLGIPRHLDRKNLDAMIEEEPSHVFNQ